MFSHRFGLLFVLILCLLKYAVPHVTQLIHYRSVRSPVFDPNLTMLEASQLDLERSIGRGLELWKISSSSVDFVGSVSSQTNAFFAYIQIGTPRIGQYVIIDTGSSLFWVYGVPCTRNAPTIRYDSKGSSSFESEFCNTTNVCSQPQGVAVGNCDDAGNSGRGCFYRIEYKRGNNAYGFLGRDDMDIGGEYFGKVVFGSAFDGPDYRANGVLGLGGGSFSIIEQNHSPNFGYCFGNISDPGDESSKLIIGMRDDRVGNKTPLMKEKNYFINLEGILIGSDWLDIDPLKLKRYSNFTGGMAVDTGSTYTYLPQFVMDQIHDKFDWILQGSLRRVRAGYKSGAYELVCYSGVVARDLAEFPVVLLRFQDFAGMPLTARNIFVQFANEVFCLAFLPSSVITGDNETTMGLLGNLVQQHQYLNYDVRAGVLDFQTMDCDTLTL